MRPSCLQHAMVVGRQQQQQHYCRRNYLRVVHSGVTGGGGGEYGLFRISSNNKKNAEG